MPELPEVEIVRQFLASVLLKPKPKKIKTIKVHYPTMIKGIQPTEFMNNLIGQTFTEIDRYGKYLILKLKQYSIISHLRMEGKYFFNQERVELGKHDHIQFIMADGSALVYSDVRKFGTMNLVMKGQEMEHPSIAKLGAEVNSEDFTAQYLSTICKNKQKSIKELILDQESVSGIGNIYADEILYESGVLPTRKSKSLNQEQMSNIVSNSHYIIDKAILNKGTTIKSFSSNEEAGQNQNFLKVYGKVGESCEKCSKKIQKMKLGGRGTHFCSNCQK